MQDLTQFAKELARQAGALIVTERVGADLSHSYKHGNELVTNADLKADQFICSQIAAKFPDHQIISEESFPDFDPVNLLATPVWIIDPIDGTVNYAHGHCQSAVSIAFGDRGRMQVGVVYNPFTDELFSAHAGGGATLNDRAIGVSGQAELSKSIVATGFPYQKAGLDGMLARLGRVLDSCADIRRLGSAALDICWVAMGRLDGYYESLSLWDFAAARLIAMEAGAACGHFNPVPENADAQVYDRDLLITTPEIFASLQALLGDG